MAEPLLLVKTHAFGDALLCTPAARELSRESGKLWVLTGPSAAPVWERFPGIGRVFVAPIPFSGLEGAAGLLSWSLRNRKELQRVGRTVVLQGSPKVRRWVRFLTSAPMRSCGGTSLGKWEKVFPMVEGDFAGRAYADTAGVDVSDWRPVFPVSEREADWVRTLGLPQPLFAVAPGGGNNPRDTVLEKRWPPDRFAETARRLAGAGLNAVLLGGSGDRKAAEEMMNECGVKLLDLTGRTTWGQTAAILDRCAGFLGADSGTAHLATARGVPSAVLFGPSSPSCLFAPGLIQPVVSTVDCSPCYSNSLFPGCRHGRPACMESIQVDDVWTALKKVLNDNYSG
ncbi:MAG: glycosyltransferase family 9 protein [Candidatus Aegiribacteria sp.]